MKIALPGGGSLLKAAGRSKPSRPACKTFFAIMPPINPAAGFFRFPARMTTRLVLRVAPSGRAERIEGQATHCMFRVRHAEAEPVQGPVAEGQPKVVPVHGAAARITLRV